MERFGVDNFCAGNRNYLQTPSPPRYDGMQPRLLLLLKQFTTSFNNRLFDLCISFLIKLEPLNLSSSTLR